MTLTYDLGTSVGRIRLLIARTDVSALAQAVFTDEEISVMLDRNDQHEDRTAVDLLRILQRHFAQMATRQMAGAAEEDWTKVSEAFADAAWDLDIQISRRARGLG